jgi:hypothetical protein
VEISVLSRTLLASKVSNIRLLPSRMRVVKWKNDRLHKDFERVEVNREKAKACNVPSN